MLKIDSIPTNVLRNLLTEAEWQRVICGLKCNNCKISGMWWSQIHGAPNGEEQYRCQDCKQTFSIVVPLKWESSDE